MIFYLNIALCVALLIALIVTQFTDGIYYFTEDNDFIHGEWYWVLIVPMLALISLNLLEVIRERKFLNKKYFIAFVVYLVPLLIVMTLQMGGHF